MKTWGVYVDEVTGEVSVVETGEAERALPGCTREATVAGDNRVVALCEAATKVGAVWVNLSRPHVHREDFQIPEEWLTGPPTFHLRRPVPADFTRAWIDLPPRPAAERQPLRAVSGGRNPPRG